MDEKTYTGNIKQIELLQSTLGYDKKVVTIEQAFQRHAYIEFRSQRAMKQLEEFTEGDYVAITAWTEGKRSRLGQHYNNIIAKYINRVQEPVADTTNLSI